MQVAKSLDEKVSRFLQVMLDACAYAGTGDVLKVQQLLAIAGEHPEGEAAAAAAGEEGTAWKTLHQSGGCPLLAGCLWVPAPAICRSESCVCCVMEGGCSGCSWLLGC